MKFIIVVLKNLLLKVNGGPIQFKLTESEIREGLILSIISVRFLKFMSWGRTSNIYGKKLLSLKSYYIRWLSFIDGINCYKIIKKTGESN